MGQILADLIEQERLRGFWNGVDKDLRRLQAGPVALADCKAEIQIMDGTLLDGIEEDQLIE